MKRLVFVLLVAPLLLAAGVKRDAPPPPEVYLFPALRNATMAAGGNIGAVTLPSRGFRIERVQMWVTTAGGGGAGNTVVTFTDGTNACTATWTCVASSTGGVKAAALAGSCIYPPGATITSTVTTGGCTSTQPVAYTIPVLGNWL